MEALSLFVTISLIDRMTSPLRRIERQAKEVSKSFREIEKSVKGIDRSVVALSKGFDRLGRTIEKAQAPFQRLKEQASTLADWSKGMMLKGAATFTVGIIPTVSAADFEAAVAEIATLTDMSVEEFKKRFAPGILDFAKEIGASPVEVAKAMYQAISAGIAPEKALDFLKGAGKAAIAGVSDIFTATDALTSMLNAWKKFGYTTKQISDYVFVAIREGKTTFNEIASSIGEVAGIAATAGVSLEETLAAMSTLTTLGNSTSEAFTGIKYAVESIINPTEQAEKWFEKLGVQIDANTLKNYGLKGTLEILTKAVQRYTKDGAQQQKILAEIFSSTEALDAVLKLTGAGAEKFNDILKKMGMSAGATDTAFKKMSQTTAFQFKQLKANLQALSITIGSVLLPSVNVVLGVFKSLLSPIARFAQRFPMLSKVILGAVIGLGALMLTLGALGLMLSWTVRGFIAYRTALALLITYHKRLLVSLRIIALGFRSLSAALLTNPIGLIATAIAFAGYLIYKNWNKVKGLWDSLKSKLSAFTSWLSANWKKALSVFLYINPITAPMVAFQKLISLLKSVNLFEAGRRIILSLWEGMKSVALKPVETIKDIAQKIRNFLPFSPAKEGPLKDLHKTGFKLIQTIATSITPIPLIKALSNALNVAIPKTAAVAPVKAPLTAPALTINVYLGSITINGSVSRAEADRIVAELETQIRKIMEKISRDKWRRGF